MDVLSGYEKVRSILSCVVVTIVGIIAIGISVHLILSPKRKSSVEGTVKSYDPNSKTINVSYKVNGTEYFLTSAGNVAQGGTVIVLYEEGNPTNARLNTQISNKNFALILIGGSIIIMALTYLSAYFVFKSKEYATVAGGMDIANQVVGMIKK